MSLKQRVAELRQLVEKHGLYLDSKRFLGCDGWFIHTKKGLFGWITDRNVIVIKTLKPDSDSMITVLEDGYEDLAKEIKKLLEDSKEKVTS